MILPFGIKLSTILTGLGFFAAYLLVISIIGGVAGFSRDKSDEQ